MEDFVKEAILIRKLKHPNVIGLLCLTVKDNVPCIVQEHMENGELRTFLHNSDKVWPFVF